MKKMWILLVAILVGIPVISGLVAGGASPNMEKNQNMHNMIGVFQYDDGKVMGKYVNFTVNPKTGEINNYSVNNITVFNSITYKNIGEGKIRVSGAKFTYYGMWGKINISKKNMSLAPGWRFVQSIDTPVGILHIVTHGSDVITYALSQGINATIQEHTVILNGKISAYILISNGAVKIENNEIIVNTGTPSNYTQNHKYMHHSTSILFIEPRYWRFSKQLKDEMMNAFERGRIGGEMYINSNNTEFVNYTYGLQAKLMLKERNHIQLKISGNDISGGRIMLINIENTTLNYDAHHRLIVKLDGKSVKETSVDNVMTGGTKAKYAIQEDGGTYLLMVYIPHFSEHTLDVVTQALNNNDFQSMLENPILLGIGVLIVIGIIGAIIWRIKLH